MYVVSRIETESAARRRRVPSEMELLVESDDVDSTCYKLDQRCECSREDWTSLPDAPRHGQEANPGPHYPLQLQQVFSPGN